MKTFHILLVLASAVTVFHYVESSDEAYNLALDLAAHTILEEHLKLDDKTAGHAGVPIGRVSKSNVKKKLKELASLDIGDELKSLQKTLEKIILKLKKWVG